MIRIALIGYGKMGKTIEKILAERYPDMQVVLKIGSSNMQDFTTENLQKVDIAIEFSRPESAYKNVLKCFEANIPVVCGTTGWYDELNIVKQLCIDKKNTLLYGTNFSVGVNIFFELNKKLAQLMQHKSYEAKIDEIHHLQKLDKPSGTAVSLANDLIVNNNNYKNWSLDNSSLASELAVYAHREDNVPGTHTITYQNNIDKIEITHTAFSREGFADGAILASRWLVGKVGYFEMKDVLAL
jgi:4-hydroxy-tetrahydrodipicolinate reductase